MSALLNVCRLRSFAAVVVGIGTILTGVHGATGQVTYELFHAFPGFSSGGFFVPASPGPLIQASDGHFYGTTVSDGASFCGSVYRITAAGDLTTLHVFKGGTEEGCSPFARLIQARDGTPTFYGTTFSGGTGGTGTVFKITLDGLTTLLTTLHSFSSNCTDGCFPTAGLIQASDDDLYGTTDAGGPAEGGTVFKITAAGAFSLLHSFDCNTVSVSMDGCHPLGSLIQASNGDFYGTTRDGTVTADLSACYVGTVFKMTAAGALTTVHAFGVGCVCADGCSPTGGLIQALDGNFYGMTSNGGPPPCPRCTSSGTIFKVAPAGILTTLHTFSEPFFEGEGRPTAGLIQGREGNFYGTIPQGGPGGRDGTVFTITPAGTFTTLHFFRGDSTEGFEDREPPFSRGLMQARDGTLYGNAPFGGPERPSAFGGLLFRLVGRLNELNPARVWIGLKNSDDVGLRLDLLAEVFVAGTKVGAGRLYNVSAGSSGFNNAALQVIPLALTGGPVEFPAGAAFEIKVAVRRTCSGGGHLSGTARLWYNGHPFSAHREADSRLDAIPSDPATLGQFLRAGFALSTTPGRSRQSIDVRVDTKEACPDRTFQSFGTWSNNR